MRLALPASHELTPPPGLVQARRATRVHDRSCGQGLRIRGRAPNRSAGSVPASKMGGPASGDWLRNGTPSAVAVPVPVPREGDRHRSGEQPPLRSQSPFHPFVGEPKAHGQLPRKSPPLRKAERGDWGERRGRGQSRPPPCPPLPTSWGGGKRPASDEFANFHSLWVNRRIMRDCPFFRHGSGALFRRQGLALQDGLVPTRTGDVV